MRYSLYRIYPGQPEELEAIEDFIRWARSHYLNKQVSTTSFTLRNERAVSI